MAVDDQHRTVRVVEDLSTGAPEKHAAESAAAAASQNYQLCPLGVVDEILTRLVLDYDSIYWNIGVTITESGQALGEQCAFGVLAGSPIDLPKLREDNVENYVRPGMDGDQLDAT